MRTKRPMAIHCTTMFETFPPPESLLESLKTHFPQDSLASWGTKPGTKNVHNLWLELSRGESMLSDTIPADRKLHCAVVRILNHKTNKILLESDQELSDGSIRSRSRPLSEKMKANEDVEGAALRAIKEELGPSWVASFVPGAYKMKKSKRESDSYPGLDTTYVVHTVHATVEGLPDEDFTTEEEEYGDCLGLKKVADKAVHVKRHFWQWADYYVEEE
ncbi:unnamed protein product [Dovyalis caffra]|uniref:Nudix hydrolase domain-containing protein n=1 Tax=Dovyalis caffra TaxID=77055 RepID=A0AAV1QX33_9ROSI|nr:unnamed protein product [Dovyalis caffra]